jgi:hypothetical protein
MFELVESALPEASHSTRPVDQRAQGAELRAVVRLATFVAVAHQTGLLQNAEVLRDRRLRDPGPSRQAPNRLLSFVAQSFENSPPSRIGKRSEEYIVSVRHMRSITRWLWINL